MKAGLSIRRGACVLSICISFGAMLSGLNIDRDVTIDTYPQTFYNLFGDVIGGVEGMRFVFDYFDYQTTAQSMTNYQEGFLANTRYYKNGQTFIGKYQGLALFSDRIAGGMNAEFAVQEANRRTMYSSYVLANNLLDGIFLKISLPRVFQIDGVLSYLKTNAPDTASGTTSTGDYDYPLFRGEENNYLMGLKFSLDALAGTNDLFSVKNVSVSYAGIVHRDVLARADMFNGSAPLSAGSFTNDNYSISNITIRIAPYRSRDGGNFTALYNVEYDFAENGKSNIAAINLPGAAAYTNYDAVRLQWYVRIPEGTSFTFTQLLNGVTTRKAIAVRLTLANSYYVQNVIGPVELGFRDKNEQLNLPQDTVLTSLKHDIRDFSNYGVQLFLYGIPVANHNFGIEASIRLFGFDITGGGFLNLQIAQAARIKADYSYKASYAYFAEMQSRFGGLFMKFGGYHCDGNYYTSLYTTGRTNTPWTYYQVLDNDNDDFLTPYFPNRFSRTEKYESPTNYAGDVNYNNFPDFLEDFLMFDKYPYFFDAGDDNNNNGIVDRSEDDSLADLRYRENLEGLKGTAVYTIIPGFDTSLFASAERIVTSPDIAAWLVTPRLSWYFNKPEATLFATISYKRAADVIYNNLSEGTITESISSTNDQLLYTDSHVGDAYFKMFIYPFPDSPPLKTLQIRTIAHAEGNFIVSSSSIVLRSGILGYVGYGVPLNLINPSDSFLRSLGLDVKIMAHHMNRVNYPAVPANDFAETTFAGMIRFSFKLSPKFSLYSGYQYMQKFFPYRTIDEYRKHSFAVEVDMNAGDLMGIVGFMLDYLDYSDPAMYKFAGINDGVFVRLATKI
ncbi:MAG: hypothetical protein AABZ39_05040 [Spirochaetota bacterium]